MSDKKPLIDRPNYYRVHLALHKLWSDAIDHPGYDKKRWKELEAAIGLLATDGPG